MTILNAGFYMIIPNNVAEAGAENTKTGICTTFYMFMNRLLCISKTR